MINKIKLNQAVPFYLFHPDVEIVIEEATAIRLESFIAMKTKAIYNSMLRWADISTRSAKSILHYFQSEKKEAIERIHKRQQNQFIHEEHNKPRQ